MFEWVSMYMQLDEQIDERLDWLVQLDKWIDELDELVKLDEYRDECLDGLVKLDEWIGDSWIAY